MLPSLASDELVDVPVVDCVQEPLLVNAPPTSSRPSLVAAAALLEKPWVVTSAHRLLNVPPPLTVRPPAMEVRPELSNDPLTVDVPFTFSTSVLVSEAGCSG